MPRTITVLDPRLNAGRATNIPLVDKVPAGDPITAEHEARAIEAALASGQRMPAYRTPELAVRRALATPLQPPSASRRPGLIPLHEAIRERLEQVSQVPPPDDDADAMAAAAQLLEGLKEPLLPLEGARRVEPRVMTDAEGVASQMFRNGDTYFADAPPELSRPLESVVPREGATLGERDRIIEMMESAPGVFEARGEPS